MKYIQFILLTLFCLSCTPTQHFVPARPVGKDYVELRAGAGWSLNKFTLPSFQVGAYYGISEKDVIGVSTGLHLIPSELSYVHYFGDDRENFNLQFHLNDMLGLSYSPTYELKVAYNSVKESSAHSFTAGVGYYGTPLMHKLAGNTVIKSKFVPIAGYMYQQDRYQIEMNWIYGMTDYFINYYRHEYLHRSPDTTLNRDTYFAEESYMISPLVFEHDEVVSITDVATDWQEFGWEVLLANGDVILLLDSPYYPDYMARGFLMNARSHYPASENHTIVNIFPKDSDLVKRGGEVRELRLEEILQEFHQGGKLDLSEDTNLVEQKLRHASTFPNDFFFSVHSREHKMIDKDQFEE